MTTAPFSQPIAESIWDLKYRLRMFDGTHIDQSVEDTWHRIANALAAPEPGATQDARRREFYAALEDFKFLPAGRIVSGAGTDRNVTLFNCYVMGTIPDDMGGIFDMLKEAALTMQQGGGIGYDFSTLRPKGAEVKGVSAEASGPLTFMDVWDAMCRTIMSAGTRRGAMMGTMRCDHPDIYDFIHAKSDPTRLRMFNLSVLATDDFMRAVQQDAPWALTFGGTLYQTVQARELWDAITTSTYNYAEPGVIFIDEINRKNNLRYCETISATNPCGEQPLPPYGACLLGSINLTRFVNDPFSDHPRIKSVALDQTVKTAVRMLDNVIDVSNFPLRAQRDEAYNKRRIGLGVTGLADFLAMVGLKYDSSEGRRVASQVMQAITESAYTASVELAVEKGAFPAFDAEGYLAEGTFASTLPPALKSNIRKYGIRNSHLTSIAPTGTISLYAGNVSSGIEPIFARDYTRKVLQNDGTKRDEIVKDYAVNLFWWKDDKNQGKDLPDYFQTAQDLPVTAHVRMQAVIQQHVDSSISKTINVPVDYSFEDFQSVYQQAWVSMCKGCTTYRPNDVTGSILSVDGEKDTVGIAAGVENPPPRWDEGHPAAASEEPAPLEPRPEDLDGTTYKLKMPGDEHALYLTVTQKDGRPFEIFLNSKNMEHYQWTVALTRMVSAVFRRGGDVGFVADELKNVFDPKGGGWVKGRYVPSILAMIGWKLEEHMRKTGYLLAPPSSGVSEEGSGLQETEVAAVLAPKGPLCPKCMSPNFKHEGGCATCADCGHSNCG